MPRARLLRGKHYEAGRKHGRPKLVPVGTIVELSRQQFASFNDRFEWVDPPEPDEPPHVGLKMVHKGSGKYDVIRQETGEKVNDHLLTKAEALAIAEGEAPDTRADAAEMGLPKAVAE